MNESFTKVIIVQISSERAINGINRLISIVSKPISIVVAVVVVVVQKKVGPKMGSIFGSMLGFNI